MNLNYNDLRFFPAISLLPVENQELFNLFDIIPSENPLFEVNKKTQGFSSVYQLLLQSQPDSFIVKTAKSNFENPSFWLQSDLVDELPKTPVYTPEVADVSNSIVNAPSFVLSIDSSTLQSAAPIELVNASVPSFVVNSLFRAFNQTAAENQFIFNLRFDKMVSQPVRPGGWFSQALFTHALQSGGQNWLTGPGTVTWDSLFGENGILKFICNGTLAVSGITMELQIFGQFDKTMLDALRNSNDAVVWPFYLNVENLTQVFSPGEDGSITIRSHVPSSEILLLVMQTAGVND